MADVHSATAADFDRAAQRHANSFWGWLFTAGIVWWLTSIWWAAIPAAAALYCAVTSVQATLAAIALRSGKFRLFNVNNGAPDGDAANIRCDQNDQAN